MYRLLDSTTDSPTASSNDAKSMFGVSCDNWKSLLDVLIVFGIILLFLALLDHLFLPTKNGMSEKVNRLSFRELTPHLMNS